MNQQRRGLLHEGRRDAEHRGQRRRSKERFELLVDARPDGLSACAGALGLERRQVRSSTAPSRPSSARAGCSASCRATPRPAAATPTPAGTSPTSSPVARPTGAVRSSVSPRSSEHKEEAAELADLARRTRAAGRAVRARPAPSRAPSKARRLGRRLDATSSSTTHRSARSSPPAREGVVAQVKGPEDSVIQEQRLRSGPRRVDRARSPTATQAWDEALDLLNAARRLVATTGGAAAASAAPTGTPTRGTSHLGRAPTDHDALPRATRHQPTHAAPQRLTFRQRLVALRLEGVALPLHRRRSSCCSR